MAMSRTFFNGKIEQVAPESQLLAEAIHLADLETPAIEIPELQKNVNQESTTIITTTPSYTFSTASLGIKRLSINAGIRERMDASIDFRNYIYQAITLFMSDPNKLEWECPIPDYLIGDGITYVTLHRYEKLGERHPVNNADMSKEYLPVVGDMEVHIYC